MNELEPATRADMIALRAVRRRLRWGALLAVVAAVGLALTTDLSFWEILGIPFFYLLLPAVALAQLPLLELEEMDRMTVYVGSAFTILAIGAVGLGLGWRVEGLPGLGLQLLPAPELAGWTMATTVAGIAVIGIFVMVDGGMREGNETFLLRLLPKTAREKSAFAGLSAAAGLGEELAYRGYALVSLQLLGPGPWTAAALSSAAFGFLHAYQGPVGIVRTGVMGFVLAVPVVVSGSLLPAMLAHALIDLFAGFVLGPRLIRQSELGSWSSRDDDPLARPPPPP